MICLGDAAFCPSPCTGMGTSLAVLGAYVLAGELSCVDDLASPTTFDGLTAALTRYEERFRPFVVQSQVISRFVPEFMHPGSAWKRTVLHGFVRLVSMVLRWEWVGPWLGDTESRDDGFKLPEYAAFERVEEKAL